MTGNKNGMKDPAHSLFVLTSAFSIVLMLMYLGQAFGIRNTPGAMNSIYILLLGTYIANKEFVNRWIRQEEESNKRPGEYIFLLWGLEVLGLFIAEYLSEGRISPPSAMLIVFAEVIVLYFGSVTLKSKYDKREKKKK